MMKHPRPTPLNVRPLLLRSIACVAGCTAVFLPTIAQAAPNGTTVTPEGQRVRSAAKLVPIAVVAATDTGGNLDMARRALVAANATLASRPGFFLMAPGNVARALSALPGARGGLEAIDHQAIGKALKAARTLTIAVTSGPQSPASANFGAVAELYDTKTGGLIGRGQGSFTATPDNMAPGDNAPAPNTPANAGGAAAGTTNDTPPSPEDLQKRALTGAVADAILALDQTAQFNGIVIAKPTIAGSYMARLSLGEYHGLRKGARIEYLENGQTIAYGTVIDLGAAEAVATIAPETAVTNIYVNSAFRTASNPIASRAGKTQAQIDDQEFRRFERQFGTSLAIAGVAYLLLK